MTSECGTLMKFFTHLTTDELRSFLNDDKKIDELLKDEKQGNDRETEKDVLLASNRSLAEYNLQIEPILISCKNDIIKCSEVGEELYNKVFAKYEQYLALLGQNKLDTKLDNLQIATKEVEERSEKIANDFLANQIDVDSFVKEFIYQRNIMHLYKVQTDKMSEMIRLRGNVETRGGNHDAFYSSNNIGNMAVNGMLPSIH